MIGVKDELSHVTVETEQITEEYQTLWIKIDNSKNKINIGCLYAPQENKTKVGTLNKMYEHVKAHIKKSRQDNERIIITGDFNAKVGDMIKDNTDETSKSGKILKRMVLKEWCQRNLS